MSVFQYDKHGLLLLNNNVEIYAGMKNLKIHKKFTEYIKRYKTHTIFIYIYIYNILNENKIIAREKILRYHIDPASIRLD